MSQRGSNGRLRAAAARPGEGGPAGWLARLLGRRGAARPAAATAAPAADRIDDAELATALASAAAQDGRVLLALCEDRPRLVVLLRHLGCMFCREALAELARGRQLIEGRGVGIVLVHLARDDRRARRLFEIYKLADLPRISDPERRLYQAFGLGRGGAGDLFGPHVLARMVETGCRGHLPGRIGGDARQMPGVFLIHRGRVLAEFRHRTAADRPDYTALADRFAEQGTA